MAELGIIDQVMALRDGDVLGNEAQNHDPLVFHIQVAIGVVGWKLVACRRDDAVARKHDL